MKEVWKPIPGYEGFYEASDKGRVRSVERIIVLKDKLGKDRPCVHKSRILKPCERTYIRSNIKPRKQVVLCVHPNKKSYDVHRIIASTFVPNPNNYDTVNHIDGDQFNNTPSNLEWISKADNNRHAFKNNLIHTQKLIAKLDPATKEILKVYPGEAEACRRIGISQGKIRTAMQNNRKLRGFYWKYIDIKDEGVTTIEPWLGFQVVE